MAGDWIKVKTGLLEDVAVLQLSEDFSQYPHETLSDLYSLACWFKTHSKYGVMRNCQESTIDSVLGGSGTAECLINRGFLIKIGNDMMLGTWTDVSSIRKSIGKKLRAKILRSGKCAQCGSAKNLQVDHIIPVAKGGPTEAENLQPLCRICNIRKGSK